MDITSIIDTQAAGSAAEPRLTCYHAGPSGLAELVTARTLIDNGSLSVEQYALDWERKWGDHVLDPWELMGHPCLDEVSFFATFDEAVELAERIGGQVYVARLREEDTTINHEGYLSVRLGPGEAIAVEVAS